MSDSAARAGATIFSALGGGLGAMMVGGGGSPIHERQDRDFYPSPPEVTRALLAVESFTGAIW